MSERLTKLFSLPANLYAEGSPLVISAGNLLRDNETGNVLVQLKIRNISMKMVKAVVVLIRALDTAGRPLEEETSQEYLDLSVPQGEEFGQKVPIPLPNPSTRGIVAEVQEVVFSDNSTWKSTDALWNPLPSPEPLSHKLSDSELVKQYKIKFGNACDCWPQEYKDLWLCTCGTWNREDDCYRCKKNRTSLLNLDLDVLKNERDARLAKEKADREAREAADKAAAEKAAEKAAERAAWDAVQKVAAEKRKRKNRRIACIFTLIAALVVGSYFLWTEVIKPNQRYKEAIALFDAGKYEEAIVAFEAMEGFKDSVAQIEKCEMAIKDQKYDAAIALFDAGKYEEAIVAFEAMEGFKDSVAQIEKCEMAIKDQKYDAAIVLYNAGKYEEAISAFRVLDGYKDSEHYIREYLVAKAGTNCTIVAGAYHTAGIKQDGRVIITIPNNKTHDYSGETANWKSIIAVSIGDGHLFGLRSGGTVVAARMPAEYSEDFPQFNISNWKSITAIAAGTYHLVGLKTDGTVAAAGKNDYGQCNVSSWNSIVAIAAGRSHTVGLKADGTVVAVGSSIDGACDVSDWKDIIAISAGLYHTVGLKADGTVVATGYNKYGQCNVSGWKDIVMISAGWHHTIGLKADGTVVATGYNEHGECNVSSWKNIIAVSGGANHTVGLKTDGTVVAIGYDEGNRCDVSDWKGIKLPELKYREKLQTKDN